MSPPMLLTTSQPQALAIMGLGFTSVIGDANAVVLTTSSITTSAFCTLRMPNIVSLCVCKKGSHVLFCSVSTFVSTNVMSFAASGDRIVVRTGDLSGIAGNDISVCVRFYSLNAAVTSATYFRAGNIRIGISFTLSSLSFLSFLFTTMDDIYAGAGSTCNFVGTASNFPPNDGDFTTANFS